MVFGYNSRTVNAEENAIGIQSPRKIESTSFIPIDATFPANLKNGVENQNSENVQQDGKSKILMVVGHPKNDKV